MMGGGLDGARRMMNQETSKARDLRGTLRRLGGYFGRYVGILFAVLVLILFSTWAQVATPELVGQAVDCFVAVTPQSVHSCWFVATPGPDLEGFGRLILILVALFVAGAVVGGLTFFLMSWTGQHVIVRLRAQVFRQIHRLSLGYYTVHEAGDVMSRMTNDVDTIQQAMSFGLVQVASGSLLIIWLVVQMLRQNVAYALLALTVLPLMIGATLFLSDRARKAFRQSRIEMGSVNAGLQESISGVREVQAFSREDENIASFSRTNAANRAANIRAVRYTSALAPTLELFSFVSIAIVVGVGGLWALRGTPVFGTIFTLGLVVTFLGYVQRLNQPIQMIAVLWTNLQSAIAGSERIFEFLDEVPSVLDRPGARPIPPIRGHVKFEGVWAGYETDRPVLRGIDLEANPGQTIAIVGPTGAGKTTIINLIPRFWDVSAGRVTIDGFDVRDVTQDSLHQQIGIVLQDTFLFSDTVLNNIRYARPDASDEEAIAAARMVQADGFIERLPDGFHTVLGERGGGLSQGQRQLIAIARAALADPRLLILDEATSSVDTRTERLIQRALETLMVGRTSFVIAHRLSTIRGADLVLFLQDGQTVERGTHEELLAHHGAYYDLYMSQFRALDDAPAEGQPPASPERDPQTGLTAQPQLALAPTPGSEPFREPAVPFEVDPRRQVPAAPQALPFPPGPSVTNGSRPTAMATPGPTTDGAAPTGSSGPGYLTGVAVGFAAMLLGAALSLGVLAWLNGGTLHFVPSAPAVATATETPLPATTLPAATLSTTGTEMPAPAAIGAATSSTTPIDTPTATRTSPTARPSRIPRPTPTLRIEGR